MKNKKLIIVALLLLLYLAPISSVSAVYGDESPQSIYHFDETLNNNVLFYPDALVNDTVMLAESGDGTWFDADRVDSAYWYGTYADGYVLAQWNTTPRNTDYIESFDYAFYGHAVSGACYFVIRTASSHTVLETIATGANAWYNGSFVPDATEFYTINSVLLNLGLFAGSAGNELLCDYVEISSITYMTFSSETHYAESFADVSEWSSEDGDELYSSDGDIVSVEMDAEGDDDYEGIVSDISIPIDASTVIELRMLCNTTFDDFPQVRLYAGAGGTGSFYYYQWVESTSWTTYKYNIKSVFTLSGSDFDTILSIKLLTKIDLGEQVKTSYDYLRVGPPDEMGFQHDGSTTEGFSNLSNMNLSTDGDLLTMTATGGTLGDCRLYPDTTTTKIDLDTDYYQFLEVSVSACTSSTGWYLTVYWVGGGSTNLQGYTTSTGIFRYNLEATASGNDLDFLYFIVRNDGGSTTTFDYIKAYSIANNTVSMSGSCTTADVLYCDSGNLIRASGGSGNYITCGRDPALSVDVTAFTAWNVEQITDSGGIDFKIDGAWLGWTFFGDATRGGFSGSTLSDINIITYGQNTIYNITFIDSRMWQQVDAITVYFVILVDYFALNMFLMLMGLVLVVMSVCYAAYKLRSRDVNSNILLYTILLFFLGWALFLGGAIL